jgi:hypothetical protein
VVFFTSSILNKPGLPPELLDLECDIEALLRSQTLEPFLGSLSVMPLSMIRFWYHGTLMGILNIYFLGMNSAQEVMGISIRGQLS